MGTGTCAVDGCTALEFRTTGRCLNHQDIPAKPQAASSGPSAINFSNPGHAPEVPGAINFSEADQPSAAPEDYMVEVGGTQMEVRDAVRSIPGPPSPTPSLISVGVIVGSLALLVSALLIDVHHGWYQLFCGAMVVGSLVLIVFEARSSNIKKKRWKTLQQVAIVVDGNDERCPSYPYRSIAVLSVAGVLFLATWGLGVLFLIWASVEGNIHQKKVKVFEAWARETYR